ncbi:hypothetical protein AAU57_12025 [Nonlabens sp. YIK11]|uniref:DUF551 domain-containing protein n=1 Tax=Nonlabens sp. YIK11 TaxID=1453349 RepID=UPI0006DC4AC6|nr:DUF551 domain-containing protein [Nonlabens sp. YIK11]KQC33975.1 hypothetical protein AAU57_12025 [Nonlabens sp. YIK11]
MEWISVNDRLPEDKQQVMGFLGDHISGRYNDFKMLHYSSTTKEWINWETGDNVEDEMDSVFYWQELPEPPTN